MSGTGVMDPVGREDDAPGAAVLRPRTLDEFVGQEAFKRRLKVFVTAARKRGEALDHVLLSGPPGLGKTTMAHILAREMGNEICITAGPILERQGDLASLLTRLGPGDILFIDEIHRMNRAVEEVLYSAMEDFKLDIMLGKGPSAQSIRLDLQPFTLVGATTRTGLLTSPLRDRFGISHTLEFYEDDDLFRILLRSAAVLGVAVDEAGARELARRSRGTPRIANRLLRRVRDFAEVEGQGRIDRELARSALTLLGIDERGLQPGDRRLMELLTVRYRDWPVGIKTLAVSLGEEPDTIEEVLEPYLIKIGFVARTPRGRVATPDAFRYFGLPAPVAEQGGLPFDGEVEGS